MPWLIVGIAGCTCSGKSTLARHIAAHLERLKAGGGDQPTSSQFRRPALGSVHLIRQDDYFYRRDRPEHTWIPGWNYINREILSALDMRRMCADIEQLVVDGPPAAADAVAELADSAAARLNVLLVEGFLIFNHPEVRARCALRFDVRIPLAECQRRRLQRQYNPPNPPGYFEQFIWPYYLKHREAYEGDEELVQLDGRLPEAELLDVALHRMEGFWRRRRVEENAD